MTVTVIIPTFDHGALLELSLASVLGQSHADLEVLVIGDGIPDAAREAVEAAVSVDERVRLLEHPKSPRTGEPYRHEALQHARGEVVCYLSDDDLWFPDHVERMFELLAGGADFVHALPAWIAPDGSAGCSVIDLAHSHFQQVHLAGSSRISLSFVAHTIDAYRRLPHGWRTTPRGHYTDWYMWSQFLETPGMRFASGLVPSVLHLGGSVRTEMTLDERYAEQAHLSGMLTDAELRLELVHRILAGHGGPRYAAHLEIREAELESRIAAMDEQVAGMQEQIAGVQERIDEGDAQIQRLSDELDVVLGSRAWRAAERLRRIARRTPAAR